MKMALPMEDVTRVVTSPAHGRNSSLLCHQAVEEAGRLVKSMIVMGRSTCSRRRMLPHSNAKMMM